MGLLLLLGFFFSLQDLQLGGATSDRAFEFESVTLSIEPSNAVARGTDVTLRCKAKVLTAGPWALRREYVLSRDGEVLYNKTTSSSQDFLLQLPDARVSSNGRYQCNASLEGQRLASGRERLAVSGVSTPVLQVNRTSIREGEEVLAHCSAPGETGSILVYFFVDSKEVQEHRGTPALARLRLGGGSHRVHCSYTVVLKANSVESEPSPPVTVTVAELFAPPLLEIFPGEDSVFEGDLVTVSCVDGNAPPDGNAAPPPLGGVPGNAGGVQLVLSEGERILGRGGGARLNHSLQVPPGARGLAFQCRLVVGGLKKAADRTVHVRELFSAPSLRMSPPEVFQKEPLTLTCSVDAVAEKLDRSELNYTLLPIGIRQRSGSFALRTLLSDFNYSCAAEARGVRKYSSPLTVRPKVFVSPPEISASGLVVLGRPFQVQCRSLRGSLPINYTLSRGGRALDRATVHRAQDRALFSVTVQNPDEVRQLRCEASNHGQEGPVSPELNATVIVPVSGPVLSTVPGLLDLSEGSNLELLCQAQGSPPITFRWFREGAPHPLHTSTSPSNYRHYRVPLLARAHGGGYYCEAENAAGNTVRSPPIDIQVGLAQWKKALVWAVVLLVVSVLVLVGCVLYFKSKRVRVDGASVSVWSERKPEPDNEEESTVSNEPDVEYTEVVHPRSADPPRAPAKKGTDTVYSELQNAPQGAADHHEYGSVKYADLNGEHPEGGRFHPELGLPEPVD